MSNAEKLSLDYIGHTCPIVNQLESDCIDILREDFIRHGFGSEWESLNYLIENRIGILVGKIKENATEKLRDALIDCCDDLIKAESNIVELEQKVGHLDSKIESLETEIHFLETEKMCREINESK